MPKLSEIEGLLINKKEIPQGASGELDKYDEQRGFNEAIDIISQRIVNLEWNKKSILDFLVSIEICSNEDLADAIIKSCPVKIVFKEDK